MITKENLPDLLVNCGFTRQGDAFNKTIGSALLIVDLKKGELVYPDGVVINEHQTCNFSANENFVVFECVHRLLEKGYRPEHIELEPKWKLGRGASGGRADILIRDNAKKPLLLIECKTAGNEFTKAWNKTLRDGDQLFSYAQQISETQFLCLYTSDIEDGSPTYTSNIIAHRDNEKYLDDNPEFKGFKTATDVKERFAIWRDTYKLNYTTKGIFESNIQPYHIGKDKYSLEDLLPISASDQQKKYHEFATILRQHNVSGRENAFDKLINLFLCKLVDETENPHELKFYWKGVAYDTHFDLLDRLQQLYQAGMGKFLGERITYIDQTAVKNAMRFIRQNPDATQKAVWHLFLQQKFFTNNDFSFIDVHNEKLFYQNAAVLLKILQIWQDIRLTNPNGHNQFLGDMFEGFLDQGIKQSEGQFFTPMPICKFILMSLPLESLVRDSLAPPRAVDYACGAGHFLNELALQLKPLVAQLKHGNMGEYHKAIFGIEKEYRLSKVAKVSAFMYGQQEINICYGDALVSQPNITEGSFDLLVANPPYSVRGFLETLPEEARNNYTLTATVNDAGTANSIETFFLERAKQLLKGGGVAALILPTSILSNGGNTYIRTREILLQYFDIIAIAEFGSGTFGKTGTNTVTLFLRRKPTQPDTAEHYRERVEEWFKGCDTSKRKQVTYKDEHLIAQYAAHIGVELADYQALLRGEPVGALMAHETFAQYLKTFEHCSETASLKKSKGFKAMKHDEQQVELGRRFMEYVQRIERDKLYHFALASSQPNPVVVIKSPTDTKAHKQFLGYDWSSAKGDEGIKLIKGAQGHHLTPLYDETDRSNATKLNRYIADNFDGKLATIPAALGEYASTVRLVDMLDFSRVTFEKQISLSVRKYLPISTKWPLKSLTRIADVKKGTSITQKKTTAGKVKVIAGGMDYAYMHNASNRPANTITISASGASAGYVNFWKEEIYASDCTTVRGATDEHTFFLYHVLQSKQDEIYSLARGAAQPHVYPADLESVQIPEVDPSTQTAIVNECGVVDTEVTNAQERIHAARESIAKHVQAIYQSKAPRLEIDKVALDVQYGLNEKMNEAKIGYKIFRMNEIVDGRMVDNGAMKYADISVEVFAKYKLNRGDVLFNRTNSIEHVGKTGLFDLVGDYCFASYLVRVVPDTEQVLPLFLSYMMNSQEFQKEAKGKASKAINQANINATIMRNIKIPVPPMKQGVQQRFVAEIDVLEKTIADAQTVIAAAPAKKQAIMQRYL